MTRKPPKAKGDLPAKGTRVLSDEHLRVAPELLGEPLASPARRLAAMIIDYLLVFLPVLGVALGVAYLSLRMQDPAALRALWTLQRLRMSEAPALRHAAWRDLVPLLVRMEAPGLPAAAAAAAEEGDLDRAADILADYDLMVALAIGEREIHMEGKKAVAFRVEEAIPRGIRWFSLFGVAALYFTLFTSFGGRTPGKRLAGIRVIHLRGERLSLLESFERFAGYLEIPATGGLGLLGLWRDPNRRMPHDRVAETVVLRVRKRPHKGPRTGK